MGAGVGARAGQLRILEPRDRRFPIQSLRDAQSRQHHLRPDRAAYPPLRGCCGIFGAGLRRGAENVYALHHAFVVARRGRDDDAGVVPRPDECRSNQGVHGRRREDVRQERQYTARVDAARRAERPFRKGSRIVGRRGRGQAPQPVRGVGGDQRLVEHCRRPRRDIQGSTAQLRRFGTRTGARTRDRKRRRRAAFGGAAQ